MPGTRQDAHPNQQRRIKFYTEMKSDVATETFKNINNLINENNKILHQLWIFTIN